MHRVDTKMDLFVKNVNHCCQMKFNFAHIRFGAQFKVICVDGLFTILWSNQNTLKIVILF